MKKREGPQVMARKRAHCKRLILEFAENAKSADQHALTGEFISDDAADLLGKERSQVAGYLKQMAEDERVLVKEFRHNRWYYRINTERQEESNLMQIKLVPRDNGIPLGRYFAA